MSVQKFTSLLLFILLFESLNAQQEYLLFLKDKPNAPAVELSPRALERRSRLQIAPDENDITVNSNYLGELSQKGSVILTSRWLNAVRYTSILNENEILDSFPFVLSVSKVLRTTPKEKKLEFTQLKSLSYGVADTQIRQLGIDCLHDLNYTGTGVYLAVIDAGFSGMDTISCFSPIYNQNRLLDSYDFVHNASVYAYSGHGTAVSSCIFGFRDDSQQYVGTAPGVDVALYVTEDVDSETIAEEFNLVAALERCDVEGVDLANISLGYVDFDNPADNHSYLDRDGATTIAAIGVNIAATKGILVVTAAGNSGPDYISTPCDADEALCVGAVDNLGNYAPFSSVGPTSDGDIKPNIAATGWKTWLYVDDGSLVMGNGTSFASPLACGAAASLIQAHPWASVDQLKLAIQQSAHQYQTPDSLLGYGIPNFCQAYDSLTILAATYTPNSEALNIFPNPFSDHVFISGLSEYMGGRIFVRDFLGTVVREITIEEEPLSIEFGAEGGGVFFLEINGRVFKLIRYQW